LLKKVYASKATQRLEGVTCQTFGEQDAAEIKKYKSFNKEGYGFIYVVNDEENASLKDKVHYNNFEGLTMCKPHQGQGYDILVGPGERKMILIRCSPEGYAMSSSAQTSVVHGGKKLKELCLRDGKKNSRPNPENGE
jgi:cold shock CspA family protein